ncbi:MAG: DNA-binding protein excisionase family [Bacillales bacterium]|jgi:putative molybdopterin biosynthesis protein|nr:DNA-binding protein excisionase family [Bacillales bacterium]
MLLRRCVKINKDILTPEEAAQIIKLSKYTVYEMVKRGELIATKVGRRVRIKRSDIEALLNIQAVDMSQKVDDDISLSSIIFMGSHDLAINYLVEEFSANYPGNTLIPAFVGSMDGLINLYYGKADIAGCHLYDVETKEYNIPYVNRLFAGDSIKIVNFSKRNLGWVVEKGNPKMLKKWSDLKRSDLTFVNRQKGSGTRILLDSHLKTLNVSPSNVKGYESIENTHYGVASYVARGDADYALATESAGKALGLDFVKLTEETYDLIMKEEFYNSSNGKKLLEILNSKILKDKILKLQGYDLSSQGTVYIGGL